MKIIKKISVSFLSIIFVLGGTSAALANTSATANIQSQAYLRTVHGDAMMEGNTNVNANAEASTSAGNHRLFLRGNASTTVSTNAKAKADQAITDRINSLNKLQTRVDAMAKLSASQKSSLDASIQASITDMNNLKAKIDADTDNTVLKTDIASITASYRIYMLVMPQVAIAAATERIDTIVSMMTTIATKFQTRISAAAAAGKDVTSLNVSLSDYNDKVADAKVQADAATSLTLSLTPDNGDKTKETANHQALMTARADIKTAQSDLKTARQDAASIIKALIGFGNIGISASSSASVNNH